MESITMKKTAEGWQAVERLLDANLDPEAYAHDEWRRAMFNLGRTGMAAARIAQLTDERLSSLCQRPGDYALWQGLLAVFTQRCEQLSFDGKLVSDAVFRILKITADFEAGNTN